MSLQTITPNPQTTMVRLNSTMSPESSTRKAARRELIAARCRALHLTRRSAPCPMTPATPSVSAPVLFHPASRISLLGGDFALTPSERARVHLEVELARDRELWDIGRAQPCGWLMVA